MLAQTPPNFSQVASNHSTSSIISGSLVWSDRTLFVKAQPEEESFELSERYDRDRLVECLKRSPVDCVKLDRELGSEWLLWWADACGEAEKECYMTPTVSELSSPPNPVLWFVNQLVHRITAIVLAVMMMPAIVIVVTFSKRSLRKLRQQWTVGSHGKLVQMWICPDGGDRSGIVNTMTELALKLLNVIQGKMLLSAPMPASLEQLMSL